MTEKYCGKVFSKFRARVKLPYRMLFFSHSIFLFFLFFWGGADVSCILQRISSTSNLVGFNRSKNRSFQCFLRISLRCRDNRLRCFLSQMFLLFLYIRMKFEVGVNFYRLMNLIQFSG